MAYQFLAIRVSRFFLFWQKSYPLHFFLGRSATTLLEQNKDKNDDISTCKINLKFKKAIILHLSIKIKI